MPVSALRWCSSGAPCVCMDFMPERQEEPAGRVCPIMVHDGYLYGNLLILLGFVQMYGRTLPVPAGILHIKFGS